MAEKAYIVEAVRTAGGKRDGKLSLWHPADLGAKVLDEIVSKLDMDPELVEKFKMEAPQDFNINTDVRISVGITYTPKQLYISEPNQKIVLGSKYPTFNLNYQQSIPNIGGSITAVKEIELSMSQKFMIGIFGTSQYSVSFGRFLDTTNIQIMDS